MAPMPPILPEDEPENSGGGRRDGDGVDGTGEGTREDPEEDGEGERSSLAEAAIEGSRRSAVVVGGIEKGGCWSSGRR